MIYTGDIKDINLKISDESSEYKFFSIADMTEEMIGIEDVKIAFTELIRSKLH